MDDRADEAKGCVDIENEIVAVAALEERPPFGRDRFGVLEVLLENGADPNGGTAENVVNPLLAAAAKVTVNEMALRVTSEAIQVHGGYGFTDEFPVSRFYRGARYGTLGGGTSETLRDLIGKRVLAGREDAAGLRFPPESRATGRPWCGRI